MKNSKAPAFPDIPLNTKRTFTLAIASSGCKIYIPVDARPSATIFIEAKKKELQDYLDSQEPYVPLPKEYA